jgi:pantoate--beta-alanine ligase
MRRSDAIGHELGAAGPEVVRDLTSLRRRLSDWRAREQSVGLVPTMGALHAGHSALVEAARRDCARVVATIFVNPIQFNDQSDLADYPRREAEDLPLLAAAGCDLVYMPDLAAMYPKDFATQVTVGGGLGDCLCGAARPGHMEGVATVVTKLFVQVLPDVAYFGEKDYQQFLIIDRLARDLDMPIEVRAVATVREADGLALSSRNFNLAPAARTAAPALYHTLSQAAGALRDGDAPAQVLSAARQALIQAGFERLDYLELRRGDDLTALSAPRAPCRLFAAAFIDGVRLIDNVVVL